MQGAAASLPHSVFRTVASKLKLCWRRFMAHEIEYVLSIQLNRPPKHSGENGVYVAQLAIQ